MCISVAKEVCLLSHCLAVDVSSWSTVLPFMRHVTVYMSVHMYEGESVNRSQMDIKRKTCDIQTWKKTFTSWHILQQCWYTCHITLPVHWNQQHRSLLTFLSHFHISLSTSLSSAKRLPPSCELLYATNTSRCKRETFLYEHPLHWVLLPTELNVN
jgi:hypothetical protein